MAAPSEERFGTLRRKIWRCNKKYTNKGEKSCGNKHIDDRTLYQAFIDVFYAILENKENFMNKWRQQGGNDLLQKYKREQFTKLFREAIPLSKLDIDLYFKLIEKMTVVNGEKIIVTLLGGTEVECQIGYKGLE